MKKITTVLSYILAFLLPFGSANPFNLSAIEDVDGHMTEQMGFAPVVFALCCLLSYFDKDIFIYRARMKDFVWPLLLLITTLTFASMMDVCGTGVVPMVYLIKLLAVEAGYYVMALYFMRYPQNLERSMNVYAYTCVAIILAFFTGFLSRYSYVSNGRLWIFGQNPNSFSFLMSLGAIFLAYKFNKKKSYHFQIKMFGITIKILDILSIILLLLYIVLSGSRGSFLIVTVCMAILFFNKRMLKKAWLSVPVIIAAISVGFYYYSSHQQDISLFNRFSNTENDERAVLQRQTIGLFSERPVTGWGVNGYKSEMKYRYNENRDSHNVVITTFAMAGIIGGIALLTYLFRIAILSWRNRKCNLLALVMFLDVFLMSMKTGGVLTFAMMWYAYAMVTALAYEKTNAK